MDCICSFGSEENNHHCKGFIWLDEEQAEKKRRNGRFGYGSGEGCELCPYVFESKKEDGMLLRRFIGSEQWFGKNEQGNWVEVINLNGGWFEAKLNGDKGFVKVYNPKLKCFETIEVKKKNGRWVEC